MTRPLLIALEGIDGAGTTSQLEPLRRLLEQRHLEVFSTFEPSRGPIGSLARAGLAESSKLDEATLALLFAADRLEHLSSTIEPQLQMGRLVLTDRYLLSSLAYQSRYLPIEWVASINAQARRPDLSIVFNISVATATQRRMARGGVTERFDDTERQEQVAAAYAAAATRSDVGPVRFIDAERSMTEVTEQIIEIVSPLVA